MLYRPVSSFSNTFYKLAAASSDPHIKKLSETYIVHYNFGEAIQNCTENKVNKLSKCHHIIALHQYQS